MIDTRDSLAYHGFQTSDCWTVNYGRGSRGHEKKIAELYDRRNHRYLTTIETNTGHDFFILSCWTEGILDSLSFLKVQVVLHDRKG